MKCRYCGEKNLQFIYKNKQGSQFCTECVAHINSIPSIILNGLLKDLTIFKK